MKNLKIPFFFIIFLLLGCKLDNDQRLILFCPDQIIKLKLNNNLKISLTTVLENPSSDSIIVYCFKNYGGEFLSSSMDSCKLEYLIHGLHTALYDQNDNLIEPNYTALSDPIPTKNEIKKFVDFDPKLRNSIIDSIIATNDSISKNSQLKYYNRIKNSKIVLGPGEKVVDKNDFSINLYPLKVGEYTLYQHFAVNDNIFNDIDSKIKRIQQSRIFVGCIISNEVKIIVE